MSTKEYNDLQAALLKQRERISKSKSQSKKVLVDLGVYDLLLSNQKKIHTTPS